MRHLFNALFVICSQKTRRWNCVFRSRSSNKTAFHVYHRLGFNEIGIRKNYYPTEKGREDAIVLALELREEADFYYVDSSFMSKKK